MRHCGHHVDLGRHLGEQVRQRHFDIEWCRRDVELEGHAVLLVCWVLPVQHRFRVHLTQLIDLDVSHSSVLGHLLTGLLRWHSLTSQHIIVHSTVL